MFIANLSLYKRLSGLRSLKIARKTAPLLPESGYVLDFGGGNMYTACHLHAISPGLRIHGIDVIRDQNLPAVLPEGVTFDVYPGSGLPFPDNSFDGILAASVLHHTPDPEFCVREFIRVIRPGAPIVLVEEMYSNRLDYIWIAGQDWVLNKLKKGVPVPLNFRTLKHYLSLFKTEDLQIGVHSSLRPGFPWQRHEVFQLFSGNKK